MKGCKEHPSGQRGCVDCGKAAGTASLGPLVRGLTRLQIERAILFVERINHGAAYGHDPELCLASNRVLTAMRHHANTKLTGGLPAKED
jgi:hypothetical protein